MLQDSAPFLHNGIILLYIVSYSDEDEEVVQQTSSSLGKLSRERGVDIKRLTNGIGLFPIIFFTQLNIQQMPSLWDHITSF